MQGGEHLDSVLERFNHSQEDMDVAPWLQRPDVRERIRIRSVEERMVSFANEAELAGLREFFDVLLPSLKTQGNISVVSFVDLLDNQKLKDKQFRCTYLKNSDPRIVSFDVAVQKRILPGFPPSETQQCRFIVADNGDGTYSYELVVVKLNKNNKIVKLVAAIENNASAFFGDYVHILVIETCKIPGNQQPRIPQSYIDAVKNLYAASCDLTNEEVFDIYMGSLLEPEKLQYPFKKG